MFNFERSMKMLWKLNIQLYSENVENADAKGKNQDQEEEEDVEQEQDDVEQEEEEDDQDLKVNKDERKLPVYNDKETSKTEGKNKSF